MKNLSKACFKPILILFAIFTFSLCLKAQLKSSSMIGNGMVIQRNHEFPFWGKATAGKTVTVTINGKSASVDALADGSWALNFPAMTEGGPYNLTIASAGQTTLTYTNVYVGDVWLASGQSNMDLKLSASTGGTTEATSSNNQLIRQFLIPGTLGTTPSNDLPANSSWTPATSAYAGNFTAVGYYFAKALQAQLKIPVGIILASYGGARIEAFMSKEMLGFDGNDIVLANGERERQPCTAYNTMIQPLLKFPIKGVIWYQAESNADNMEDALAYGSYFKKMITSWRENWKLGDIPFLWVQLPATGTVGNENSPGTWDAWPQVRYCQSRALSLPNTGEATSIDVGEVDIHPKIKKPVGDRLALVARKMAYNEDLVYSGPRYKSHKILDNGKVEITFDYLGSGLKTSDATGLVKWFSMASSNGTLVKANAQIVGDKVVVWNTSIPKPAIIRYAWEYNPSTVNFFNNENLPAVPFLINVEKKAFKIESFKASVTSIERGKSVFLNWKAYSASAVSLNGESVDSIDSQRVWPKVTTTYKLKIQDRNFPEKFDSLSIKVTVTEPKPTIMLTSLNGELFEPNSEVKIKADVAAPGGGTIKKVQYYIGTSLFATDSVAPYDITIPLKEIGTYSIYGVATNDKGLTQKSSALSIVVSNLKMLIYEAENATLTGGGSVVTSASASGGKYMNLADGWTLTFKDVTVPADGNYQLIISYLLNYGGPKNQNLLVNGSLFSTIEFTAPDQTTWMKYLVKIPLKKGVNTIAIQGSWNWMSFDYISIPVADNSTGSSDIKTQTDGVFLGQNFPNPVHDGTSIPFTLPRSGKAMLEIYNLNGQKEAVLIEKKLDAGSHTFNLESGVLGSGTYVVRLNFEGVEVSNKIIIM